MVSHDDPDIPIIMALLFISDILSLGNRIPRNSAIIQISKFCPSLCHHDELHISRAMNFQGYIQDFSYYAFNTKFDHGYQYKSHVLLSQYQRHMKKQKL
jgi:hypothetical protein